MSYCPKCGSQIDDESKGCKVCMGNAPLDNSRDEMPTILKVIIILTVLFANLPGAIVGLIGGIMLMKHASESYRRFGKTLVIISIVILLISLLCCVGYFIFIVGVAGIGACY